MRKIVAVVSVTLDGVMQSPGGPDEDRRGGFERGGWATPFEDPVKGRVMGEHMAKDADLLLGRQTYEKFANYWPHQKDNPFTEVLNKRQKYVASQTLAEPLPWMNSTLLAGDTGEAVARLKEQPGKDLVVLGSGVLCQTLTRHGILDEYLLLIHPVVLGSGRRLFTEDSGLAEFGLVDSVATSTGVIIATYTRLNTTHGAPGEEQS